MSSQLHQIARDIFDHTLTAVDPQTAVERAIKLERTQVNVCGDLVDVGNRPLYAIAMGKAATKMAHGLINVLGDKITAGVLSGTTVSSFNANRWQAFAGGHPAPNDESLLAAQAAFKLLDHADTEQAVVIALVSGGGSAMMEWPASDVITLDDLQSAHRILVNCGANISEVNVVRRAFSAVKGGGLARRAPHAKFITLIVSDTNKGDEASVASGPTLNAPPFSRSAADIVEQYGLQSVLPQSILKVINGAETKPPIENSQSHVLLDNSTALEAAAAKATSLGFPSVIVSEISEQAVEDGSAQLVDQLMSMSAPACLISGGEFSCPVRGDGRGGRNLETVLRCVLSADARQPSSQHYVILSAGTDGIDGNSPAAGAMADETTIDRAKSLGLDSQEFLSRSDSFGFFERLNDALFTGPTGTNVRDVRTLLKA